MAHPVRNWVGPAGAYTADLIFQGFGYAAFLLPMGIFALALRWIRSLTLDSAGGKLGGYTLLVLSMPALLSALECSRVRGAIPPGGLFGALVAAGLRSTFNTVGAHVVAVASSAGGDYS